MRRGTLDLLSQGEHLECEGAMVLCLGGFMSRKALRSDSLLFFCFRSTGVFPSYLPSHERNSSSLCMTISTISMHKCSRRLERQPLTKDRVACQSHALIGSNRITSDPRKQLEALSARLVLLYSCSEAVARRSVFGQNSAIHLLNHLDPKSSACLASGVRE